jgi:ABC-type branched-subunit amino acid transport system substrate-binding protein
MERGYKYIFHIGGLSSDFGELSAQYVYDEVAPALGKEPKDITVATIYEDSLFGTTTSSFFVKKAVQLGFKVGMVESYSAKTVDLSSIIVKLKNVQPDVVFQVSYFNDKILFQRQARELKRATIALHVSGLEVLAGFYRDVAAAQLGAPVRNPDIPMPALTSVPPRRAIRSADRIMQAIEAIEANQRPQLALAALFADVGGS